MNKPRYRLVELMAEMRANPTLRTAEEQEWIDAPAVGREVWPPYDPAENPKSEEAIATFLAEAKKTDDAAFIAHAQEVAERARALNINAQKHD